MIEFWVIAAVLIALAASCALWPLLKKSHDKPPASVSESRENVAYFKDQLTDLNAQKQSGLLSEEDHHRLKTELEKKLVDDIEHAEILAARSNQKTPRLAWLLAVLIPLMAVPLYWQLGARTELKVQETLFSDSVTSASLGQVLEDWVEEKPDNDKALFLLGSHYMETGQLDSAVKTYRTLFRMSNGHPQVAAELAQALFLKHNNEVTDEVRMLYQRTLKTDENNTTALGLKGIDAFASGDYQKAMTVWQQAMMHEVNTGARQSLNQGINQAKELLGMDVISSQIRVIIDKSPELSSLPDSARVVVFARPSGTRQPPVVAIPLTLGDMPKELVLDDSSSMMMGGNPLSSYETLDIVGRISLSGDVMKADYQVQVSGVKTNSREPVKLVFVPVD